MKTLILNPLFFLTFVLSSFSLSAQDYSNDHDASNSNTYSSYDQVSTTPRVSPRIIIMMQQLKNTHFMYDYTALQLEIEETIGMVKSNQHLYTPEDIHQIKVAYQVTATEFNRVLSEIKRGILRGQYKAKNMTQLNLQLERKNHSLEEFYHKNFKNPIETIMEGDVVSSNW